MKHAETGERYNIYRNILTRWKPHYSSLETPSFYDLWNTIGERGDWKCEQHLHLSQWSLAQVMWLWAKVEVVEKERWWQVYWEETVIKFGNGWSVWVRMIDINGDPALPLIICVTLDKSVPFQEKLFPAINNPWGVTQFPYAAKLPFSYISSPLTPSPSLCASLSPKWSWWRIHEMWSYLVWNEKM